MSNEEDRKDLAELIDRRLDGDAGDGIGHWLAGIILEAGFRRTPAPAPREVTDAAVARFVDEYNAVMLRVLDRDAVLLALTAALGVTK